MSKVSKYMVKKNQRPLVKFRTNKNSHYVIKGGKKVIVNDVVNNIYQECCKTRKRRKKNIARKAIKKNQVTSEEMLDYMYPSIRGFQYGNDAAISNAVRNQQMEFIRQRAQNYRNQQEYFQQNGLDARLRDLQEQQRRQEFVQQVQYGNLLRNIDLQFERARRDIGLQEPEFGARQMPRREMNFDEPIIRGPAPEEQKDMYEDFLGNLDVEQRQQIIPRAQILEEQKQPEYQVIVPRKRQRELSAEDIENLMKSFQEQQMRAMLRQPQQNIDFRNLNKSQIKSLKKSLKSGLNIQQKKPQAIEQAPQIRQQVFAPQQENIFEEGQLPREQNMQNIKKRTEEQLKMIDEEFRKLVSLAKDEEIPILRKIANNQKNRIKLINKNWGFIFDDKNLDLQRYQEIELQNSNEQQDQIYLNEFRQRAIPQEIPREFSEEQKQQDLGIPTELNIFRQNRNIPKILSEEQKNDPRIIFQVVEQRIFDLLNLFPKLKDEKISQEIEDTIIDMEQYAKKAREILEKALGGKKKNFQEQKMDDTLLDLSRISQNKNDPKLWKKNNLFQQFLGALQGANQRVVFGRKDQFLSEEMRKKVREEFERFHDAAQKTFFKNERPTYQYTILFEKRDIPIIENQVKQEAQKYGGIQNQTLIKNIAQDRFDKDGLDERYFYFLLLFFKNNYQPQDQEIFFQLLADELPDKKIEIKNLREEFMQNRENMEKFLSEGRFKEKLEKQLVENFRDIEIDFRDLWEKRMERLEIRILDQLSQLSEDFFKNLPLKEKMTVIQNKENKTKFLIENWGKIKEKFDEQVQKMKERQRKKDGKGITKNKKGVFGFEMDTFLKQEQENGEYLGLTNLKNLSDFLPKITPNKDTFIIILDNNHYTTLFIDTEMKNIIYYDSFGKLPPKEIRDFVSEIHKHLVKKGEEVHYRFKYNLQENQPQSDPNCSMYVLDFIDKYQDTKNFVYATKFKNPKEIQEKRQAVFPYI